MSAMTESSRTELTRNEQLVHERLSAAGKAMSAYDLLDELRGSGVRAPTQIYRALDKLSAAGLVHRIESLNAFIACSHSRRHGQAAFAICDDCGQVVEFVSKAAMAELDGWAAEHDFLVDGIAIEIRGRCAKCAAA